MRGGRQNVRPQRHWISDLTVEPVNDCFGEMDRSLDCTAELMSCSTGNREHGWEIQGLVCR